MTAADNPRQLEPAPIVAPALAFLTTEEVAARLELSRPMVAHLRATRASFPRPIVDGRRFLYRAADIDTWATLHGYPRQVAEPGTSASVSFSLPADELERVDRLARARNLTRSAHLRAIVREYLSRG